MSFAQKLILTFMVLFLAGWLTSLGYYLHYSIEYDMKAKTLWEIKGAEFEEIKNEDEKGNEDHLLARARIMQNVVEPRLTAADGKERQVQEMREAADEAFRRVYIDQTAVKPTYERNYRELVSYWDPSKLQNPTEDEKQREVSSAFQRVYEFWKAENEDIKKRQQDHMRDVFELESARDEAKKAMDQAQEQLITRQRQVAEEIRTGEHELETIKEKGEEFGDQVNKRIREFETAPEYEKDGEIIFAAPEIAMATVDFGYMEGAKHGMVFNIYSGRHSIPVLKGEFELRDVKAHSATGVVRPVRPRTKWDPATGWEATKPDMRYSVYSAGGNDESAPQPLVTPRTVRDTIKELRLERIRKEGRLDEYERLRQEAPQTTPPIDLGEGFEPVTEGDWVASVHFIRILPDKQWQQEVYREILRLRPVNTGRLTFYISDTVVPFRREYLKRLIERNGCQYTETMTDDVNYVVAIPGATDPRLLAERLRDLTKVPNPKADDLEKLIQEASQNEATDPKRLQLLKVLHALVLGQKFGAEGIEDTQMESFFLRRQRKRELIEGKPRQPGQYLFFVAGDTKLRSTRETGLYIQEMGHVLAEKITADVDFVVVGAGLDDARIDRDTGKIYLPGQPTPDSAEPFYDAIQLMGIKVLREKELPHFFGRSDRR